MCKIIIILNITVIIVLFHSELQTYQAKIFLKKLIITHILNFNWLINEFNKNKTFKPINFIFEFSAIHFSNFSSLKK